MDSKKTKPDRGEGLKYMQGFGNHFVTEALKGALPKNQNNP
jgi:homogentisate 1,2-dioxygenase